MRDPARDQQQRRRAGRPVDLVRDVDPVAAGVADRRARAASGDLCAQGLAAGRRLEAERREGVSQALELQERRRPVAALRVLPHQRAVGLLVGGLVLQQALPEPPLAQHLHEQAAEMLARACRPLLVALVGQQIAGVQRRGLPARARASRERGARSGLEGLDVGGDARARPQLHMAAAQHHGIRGPQDAPGEVRRLVQVAGARRRRQVRPQGVDDLLAVQPVPRLQGEQLDELRRAPVVPVLGRHRPPVDLDGVRAEQSDEDLRGWAGDARRDHRADQRQTLLPAAVSRRPSTLGRRRAPVHPRVAAFE